MTDSLPTISLESTGNLKEFFIVGDSLCNFDTEINFSIFKKYMCKAGCKMCYIRDIWIPDEQFGAFVPKSISSEQEENIFKMFSYYEYAAAVDDLHYIRRKYPHLFDFYKTHSHKMLVSSMTDHAFLQQFPIVMDELNFVGMYDLSFSDTFLDLHQSRMADDVIAKLTDLIAKMSISKIKIVITNKGERSPGYVKLARWAKRNNIFVSVHDDFTSTHNKRYHLEHADSQETNMISDANTKLALVLCESIYMQFTDLYLTITDATEQSAVPFYDVSTGVVIEDVISSMLRNKKEVYGRFRDSLIDRNGKFFDYFSYVADDLIVNENFNFIPRIAIKPFTRLYRQLVNKEGYVEHPQGLLKPAQQVVPLFQLKSTPKQRIEYFPIKCEKG